MGVTLGPARAEGGPQQADQAVRRLQAEWQRGRPDLGALWGEQGPGESIGVLAALVKADLGQRFARGERPEAAEYLERFPALRGDSDRVLSLVYEEYCLREERGDRPDTAAFCARYAPWQDSLASQLNYHRMISRVIGPPPAPPKYPAPGDLFAQFRIGRELGRGGSARVYLARDELLGGREVVLKVSTDRGKEPAILGRLEHPRIVAVHVLVKQPETGLRGLCMPYRPGLPVDQVIRRVHARPRPRGARALWDALRAPGDGDGPAPGGPGWDGFPARGTYAEGVAWVLATLADALAYAHARKVYHRDVKPANVLLTYRDGPQLLDFNLSHDPETAGEQAEAALRGGTLPYMAPSQLEAFLVPSCWERVQAPADLYALGLLARELLTGQGPDTPEPSVPLERAIRGLLARRAGLQAGLRRHDPGIPHALEAIVARCLAFDPADRYPDAAALAEDLRRFLARRPLRYAENPSRRERVANRLFRLRRPAAVVCLALTLVGSTVWAAGRLRAPTRADVLAALKRGQPADALALFDRLPERDRAAPVAAFYGAVALSRTNKVTQAFDLHESHSTSSADRAALADWAKGHRDVANDCVNLGAKFLEERSVRERPGSSDVIERLFRLALVADPAHIKARQALAAVDELRGNFDAAHRSLSTLIDEQATGPATGSEGPKTLRDLHQTRARVSFRRGNTLLSAPAVTDLDGAVDHLNAALSDLGVANQKLGKKDDDARFDLRYIHCEVLLALSRAAELRPDPAEALRFAQEAEDLLSTLADCPPSKEIFLPGLSGKVKTRLVDLNPDRKRLPSGPAKTR
jgi:serine/threonine protein kinase